MEADLLVILLAIAIRVLIALTTTTFFQPDEYFQSLEVAHHVVFGYGQLTWEWLAPNPLRGAFYPLLNLPVYGLLKVFGLDGTRLLIWAPKVLHGVLAAGTDFGVYRMTKNLLGKRYANVALLLSLTSFFNGLALSRSLSNSLETSLTAISLSYFPWQEQNTRRWRTHQRLSIFFAALACTTRPTSALIWVFLFSILIWRHRNTAVRYDVYIDLLSIANMCASLIFVLDMNYYGKRLFTPVNFLLTNLSSVSLFYGSSPWHYYLSQAIPVLCTTSLPFVLHGAWLQLGPSETASMGLVLSSIAWTVSIYSLTGHKEWRFIHPLLPLMQVLASKSLVYLYDQNRKFKTKSVHQAKQEGAEASPERGLPVRKRHLLLLMLSIPAIVYTMRFHSRGQIDVMYYLRDLPASERKSIGFLMPCHSTPWQSYLHDPELGKSNKLWALGCEPPLSGENLNEYKGQTDIFYSSPIAYIQSRFPDTVDLSFPPSPYPSTIPGTKTSDSQPWQHEWPQNIVLFGSLLQEQGVRELLIQKGYRQVWGEDGSWEEDPRRRGGVQVWRYTDSLVL